MGCTSSNMTPGLEANLPTEKKEAIIMRGDLSLRYEARQSREQKLKNNQQKLITAAKEMAGKIMEEKEMLSLGTRSRTTSCVTSRTGSPVNSNRRQVHFLNEETKATDNDNPVMEGECDLSNGNKSISKNGILQTKNNSISTEVTPDRVKSKSKSDTAVKSITKSNGVKIEATKNTGTEQKCSPSNEHTDQAIILSVKEDVEPVVDRLSTTDERMNSRSSGQFDSESIKRG